MKTKALILTLGLALSLAAVGVALANGGPDLPRWVLGSGASDSTAGGGAVALRGTLGQPVVGVVTVGDIALGQGFWHGAAGYDVYLPLVLRNF